MGRKAKIDATIGGYIPFAQARPGRDDLNQL
jgi:hypothetical protein